MFPSKESVPFSVTRSIDNVKNTENVKSICTFFTNIAQNAAYALSSPLTHLINLSLTTGLVPNKWEIAKVKPIHKKGNTNDYNNYRPISVLNTCSKILERAVHKQLIDHFETNDLLSKTQFGYRTKQVNRTSNDTVV